MEKKSWLQKGNEFTLVEGEFDVVQKVKPGIYNITRDLRGWHLEKFQEKFEFPFKIYGLQTDFIEYILKTYRNTTGNLGILMNGTKGAGKTVCAKVLANLLELPIVIIKSWGDSNQEMIEYVGSFNFDCVLFFDEFEKQFEEKDNTVLQIMDGVYNSIDSRRVFLLTTNKLSVNDNLISRPSRIRYIRSFKDLSKDLVKEYLNDNLDDKSKIDDVLGYIDTLADSTIDILKAIVSEINIHGFEEFKKAKSWFNVTVNNFEYSVWYAYMDEDDVEEILKRNESESLIPLFEHDLKIRSNPPLNPNLTPEWEAANDGEKKRLMAEYQKEMRRNFDGLRRGLVESEIRFDKLVVGDYFDDKRIVAIDKKRCIISTTESPGYLYFYKVLNPDQSPSLWGSYRTETPFEYGYCL